MQQNYGWGNRRAVKKLEKTAKLVEKLAPVYAEMTDEQLAAQTNVFKTRIAEGETLDKILPEAFAVCREAATRVLGQRHYFVQILGGIALHRGMVCQMATGEGKTLTETLPAYLNALSGKGVHIVTVNEYLAKRDMEWMGKVYRFLGLTVGVTLHDDSSLAKQRAYACDITYGTNSEFGFDYLRDNGVLSKEARMQRGHNFAIIDEVDSILIDEARNPLIISRPGDEDESKAYEKARRVVSRSLTSVGYVDSDGNICDERGNIVEENGKFAFLNRRSDYDEDESAVREKTVATPGYVREDGNEKKDASKVFDYIVDLKERTVRLTERGIYKVEQEYNVGNLYSPANFKLTYYIDNALRAKALYKEGVDYIREGNEIILIDANTGRKMEGRRLSDGLHEAVEAKSGIMPRPQNKTIASITLQNYFRLFNKISGMTGTAKTEEEEFNTIYNLDVVAIPTHRPMIREDEPDRIYGLREVKLNAIVAEIARRHATGQPLLVGTTSVDSSNELSRLLKKAGLRHNVLNAVNHKQEAEIIAQAGEFGAITVATNMAGRGTDILLGGNPDFYARREMKQLRYTDEQVEIGTSVVSGDEETTKLQETFKKLKDKYKISTEANRQKVLEVGGLCVIGTERHDARRIDDQLRGRAGRQGDPGHSMFFVSMQDDLLRIFGDSRKQMLMSLFSGQKEDEPMQMRILDKFIESAQKRVEGMYYTARKNTLRYDDVNNLQRRAIFAERNRLLDGNDVHGEVLEMAQEFARKVLESSCGGETDVAKWDLDSVNAMLNRFLKGNDSTFYYVYYNGLYNDYDQPILTADNVKSARQVCDLIAERVTKMLEWRSSQPTRPGDIDFVDAERIVLLRTMDRLWIDHTDALDNLRDGIGLQAIGQRDPLTEYKRQAFEMFEKLNDMIKFETVGTLISVQFRASRRYTRRIKYDPSINPTLVRNGPCPCGSGLKYKNCCFGKVPEEVILASGEVSVEAVDESDFLPDQAAQGDETELQNGTAQAENTDRQQTDNGPLVGKRKWEAAQAERRNKKANAQNAKGNNKK